MLLALASSTVFAEPGWVEKVVQSSPVTFAESPCTETGGFGQQFGAKRLVGGAKENSRIAGTMDESVQFSYKESRPPYSWFEITLAPKSKTIRTVSAWLYFSTRELADQAHSDLVQRLAMTADIKAITPNPDANQTRLFTRPLIEENGARLSREGLMIDVEVVGTMMSIACTDTQLYVREIRVFPPAGFNEKGPTPYGLTKMSEIDQPYCTRDMAFGVPFGSIPAPKSLDRTLGDPLYIRLDRQWPPFTQFEVTLSKDGQVTEVSTFVTFNTHALAHQQTLAIVKGIRGGAGIYDDTLDLRSPILHTDPPYRMKPNNDYYGVRTQYISGLAAEVKDSDRSVYVTCTRRDLRYPDDYEKYRSLRDDQVKQAK